MSRFDELKKQYPELNITMLDVLKKFDRSSTYKYLPLICKIFSTRFRQSTSVNGKDLLDELVESLERRGFEVKDLTPKEILFYYSSVEFWPSSQYELFTEFMDLMDKNLLSNKDVTSYQTMDDMRAEITLASMREIQKTLENEIIKEHEDDTWLILRPLTFLASAKYGASTRWCTTYQREKNYFERYWRTGILVYFINKKTGYKFAGFKDMDNRELSFWNAEDSRVDFLDLEVDDYLFNICRRIFRSEYTNKNLCSYELQEQVHQECLLPEERVNTEVIANPQLTPVATMRIVPIA